MTVDFCVDCGAKAFALCDGKPLCQSCLTKVLQLMDGARTVTKLDGGVLQTACFACGSMLPDVGCPSCYSLLPN